jgi:hypothetical protein
MPNLSYMGFLDAYYTPPRSKAVGRIRTLVAGVSISIMTSRTREIAFNIICCNSTKSGKWMVRYMGYTSTIEVSDVRSMMRAWTQ